jgi:hypothetical protein
MANKSGFVDLISDATRQRYRRTNASASKSVTAVEPEPKEERRLSNWPPERMEQWRIANLTPWKMKLKSWKFKDWV